jgi:hypothetical protein
MVEPAGPVDATFHPAGRDWPVDDMKNVVVFKTADVENVGFSKFAEVIGLTAGGGIQLCLV